MDIFTRADLQTLLAEREPPCISLFMPTHRGGGEEDPIRFRNLLGQAEERLAGHGFRASEAREFLNPLRYLLDDVLFWPNQSDGLAVFLARDFLRLYRLPWPFQEELNVDGLFVAAPLLPLLSNDGRFYVLALSQNSVRLFQGTRFTISPVNLRHVPRNLAEAMRTHDRDEVLMYHTRPTSGGTWGAIFSGQGVGIDDAKDDLLRYFQGIDRGLHEVLRAERAPLVLAAVESFLPIYREASKYPPLLEQVIAGNPDRLSEKELHDRAWAIVRPHFHRSLQGAIALYHQAAGTGKATSDPKQIIPAAYRGEIETLFVAQGPHLCGILDPGTSEVVLHEQPEAGDEELLNFAAIHTLRHGNTVYALREEEMPAGKFLAAIYHLPLAKHGKRP